MAPQPQTPAQPTQPTMAANVPRKRNLQSTLDAFLKLNPWLQTHGLGHVFDGKLFFTRDICEEKWIPKDLVPPKK